MNAPPSVPEAGLSAALAVLSAMIAPAVLILASSSLVLTTSNRLSRVLGRVRSLADHFEALVSGDADAVFPDEKRGLILDQLDSSATRARLLQRALSGLYSALAALTATSIALGVDAALGQAHTLVLILLGLAGVALLLFACVLLVLESQVALAAVDREMAYVRRLGDRHAGPTNPRAPRPADDPGRRAESPHRSRPD